MSKNTVPPLSEAVFAQVEALAGKPEVKAAFEQAAREADRAMEEQIELCEIEAPTFHEEKRAARVAELMRAYGLTDVVIDPIGNVVGRRPGKGEGPVLAIGAHMDSVFPAGTDVKVRREGKHLPCARHRRQLLWPARAPAGAAHVQRQQDRDDGRHPLRRHGR